LIFLKNFFQIYLLYYINRNCAKRKTLTYLNGNIEDQSCCSGLYSKVFPDKCCCAWSDNNELFPVHHTSLFKNGEGEVWSCNGCSNGFKC
jgi:hypothetical protein